MAQLPADCHWVATAPCSGLHQARCAPTEHHCVQVHVMPFRADNGLRAESCLVSGYILAFAVFHVFLETLITGVCFCLKN